MAILCGCTTERRVGKGPVTRSTIELSDGSATPALCLNNGLLSATILPELGGKIVSLKDRNGREYLSRSDRPYVRRTFGMGYGKTEFDGIDECFLSVSASTYPAEPWKGRKVADHGEVCQVAWRQERGPGVLLAASGVNFPYTFRRRATLDGRTLVLDYIVTNESDSPLHYVYAFHPLFVGEKGCRLGLADGAGVTVGLARKKFLGDTGVPRRWDELRDQEGKLFRDTMFTENSGRYWKLYSKRLGKGELSLRYRDGSAVSLEWPVEKMPYFAVWCSEGAVGGLHHVGLEPTNSTTDGLADAYAKGETSVIPPRRSVSWQIRVTVEPAR